MVLLMEGYLPAWVITLISLAGSTVITTVIGLLIKHWFKKYVDRKEREDAAAKEREKRLQEFEENQRREVRKKDVIESVTEIVKPLEEKIDKMSVVIDSGVIGTVTLLRETMKQTRDQFVNQGYASTSDDASWHELYATYKRLGGNHFTEYVDAWKEDVERLPREPKKKLNKKKED